MDLHPHLHRYCKLLPSQESYDQIDLLTKLIHLIPHQLLQLDQLWMVCPQLFLLSPPPCRNHCSTLELSRFPLLQPETL